MSGRDQSRTYSRKDSVVFLKTDEPFGGLSNMAGGYPIHVNGVRILTSEALYQACRFPHLPDVQKLIIGQISPMTAKMRSKPYRKDSRPDWDQVRVRIMRWSLRMKLANNWNAFSTLLLKTGERPIVEESRKDDFWGAKVVDDGDTLVGMNVLGRLLMELREQVKQQGRDAALDIAPPDIPQFLLFGQAIEVAVGLLTPQAAEVQEQGSLFGADTAIAVEAVADPAPVVPAKTVNQAFRASGLPWVPHIPESWQVLRNGRLFGHRVEMGFPDLPILEVSLRTGVRVRDMENLKRKQVMSQKEKYKRAAKGDIAYNMMRMWQGAVGPAPVDGLVSPAYVVVKPYDEANSSYYSYLFRTAAYMQEVNKFSRGIVADRNRLYWESFKQMPSLVPPRPEQDQIVAYLRAQDAHIARFIQAKRDLIKLLTEQKLRIIDHAVTRGLDPNVRLKPSGIEWLGEVPEHWEVQRLKNVANVVLGKMLTSEAKAGDGDFKPYLRSTNVQWIKPDVRDVKEMWVAKAEMAQLRVRKGDLLVSEGGEVGRACMWNDELPECYIQNSVHRVAAKPMMLPEFLFHQFFAYGKRGRFNAIVNRVSIAHLTREKLVTIPFTVPPVEEQQAICRWITDECKPLDDAIARTEEEIKLIREYRDRQIADVVTGQVDVRGWQPGPEDVVDDAALAALGDDPDDVTVEEDGDGED
jgi:type I restriction enzyme S subunit